MFKEKQIPITVSTRALEIKVNGTKDASSYSMCSSPQIESPQDVSVCSDTQSSVTFGDNDKPSNNLSTFRLLVAHVG